MGTEADIKVSYLTHENIINSQYNTSNMKLGLLLRPSVFDILDKKYK